MPILIFLCCVCVLLLSRFAQEVAVYEVAPNGATQAKAKVSHTHPVLAVDWSHDGTQVVSGGTDSLCKLWNLGSNQEITIGQHAAPIKSVHWVKEMNVVVTGSFDKTIKYWDMRQATPAANIQLNERVYAMDVRHPVLAVATATVPETVVERGATRIDKKNKIFVYDLSNPSQPFRVIESPLKFQHRCLSIFPDKTGFAVGSVEGRVAISHVAEKDISKNFAFKCHRQDNDIYAVNSIAFHHYGTFATAGSDGVYTFWDKDAKQRLKLFARGPNSITAGCFNPQGTIYAYALGYGQSASQLFARV
jgi:mRNA export factor